MKRIAIGITGIDRFAWTLKGREGIDAARAQGLVGFAFDRREARR